MVKCMFDVTAYWDEGAKVIEAATIEEFESVMVDVAPGPVIANDRPNLRDAGSQTKL